ncbi:MAG: tRNA (adenosine(37)-N6)-threonylcarbamoyltransferase complex ATPase subunit type 1 TsaE [Patescibacteria group bacterium]
MKSSGKIITNSAKETQELAAKFAKQILRRKLGKSAVVLALRGDLGAGKTTFLQGFARGLGITEPVNSPTFLIMKKFPIPSVRQSGRSSILSDRLFYHIDCYRLERAEELLHLGFKEIISSPQNIVAVEWPEKISELLPKDALQIKFNHLTGNKREIIL